MTGDLNRTDIITFWQRRGSSRAAAAARFHSEHTAFDLPAICGQCRAGMRLLDLGCGTCVIDNLLLEEVDLFIHAVDMVPGFLEHAARHARLTTEVADIVGYRSSTNYDLILLLGVINSIPSEQDRTTLYENCREMLAPNGTLFIKSQFGTTDTVIVDHYSEQLGSGYKAIYPHLAKETDRLRTIFKVSVEDPYPPSLNPHQNTHFYYISCTSR